MGTNRVVVTEQRVTFGGQHWALRTKPAPSSAMLFVYLSTLSLTRLSHECLPSPSDSRADQATRPSALRPAKRARLTGTCRNCRTCRTCPTTATQVTTRSWPTDFRLPLCCRMGDASTPCARLLEIRETASTDRGAMIVVVRTPAYDHEE